MTQVVIVAPLSTIDWGSDNAGGVDSVCQQLLQALITTPTPGCQYEVLALKVGQSSAEYFTRYRLSEQVHVTFVPSKGKIAGVPVPGVIYQCWQVRKFCRAHRADVVHSHYWSLLLGVPKHIAKMVTVHSFGKLGRKSVSMLNDLLYERILPSLSRHRANKVTCVGEQLRQCIAQQTGINAEVVANPINPTFFAVNTASVEKFNTPTLVTCAMIHRKKGIHVAIDIVAKLNQSREVNLCIIGPVRDHDYKAELDAQIERLGISTNVQFTGALSMSEVAQHYAKAHVGLFCSQEETFGLAPLEMVAAGLNVVSTRVGVLAEQPQLFISAGGAFIDSNDIDAAVQRVSQVLEDSGSAEPQLIADAFSAQRVNAQYQQLYKELAGV